MGHDHHQSQYDFEGPIGTLPESLMRIYQESFKISMIQNFRKHNLVILMVPESGTSGVMIIIMANMTLGDPQEHLL